MTDEQPKKPQVDKPQQRNTPTSGTVHPTSKGPGNSHTANVPKGQTVHPPPPPKKK
jgi:hypothetical protein